MRYPLSIGGRGQSLTQRRKGAETQSPEFEILTTDGFRRRSELRRTNRRGEGGRQIDYELRGRRRPAAARSYGGRGTNGWGGYTLGGGWTRQPVRTSEKWAFFRELPVNPPVRRRQVTRQV